jgi:hypothetical protein
MTGVGRIQTGSFEVRNIDKQTFADIQTAADCDIGRGD